LFIFFPHQFGCFFGILKKSLGVENWVPSGLIFGAKFENKLTVIVSLSSEMVIFYQNEI
jgi:hypothetical protein